MTPSASAPLAATVDATASLTAATAGDAPAATAAAAGTATEGADVLLAGAACCAASGCSLTCTGVAGALGLAVVWGGVAGLGVEGGAAAVAVADVVAASCDFAAVAAVVAVDERDVAPVRLGVRAVLLLLLLLVVELAVPGLHNSESYSIYDSQ